MTRPGRSDWGRPGRVLGDEGYDEGYGYEPQPRPTATGEPVVIGQAVTVLMGTLVTAGWIKLDDPTVQLVITGVGLLVSVLSTVLTRARVSPMKGGVWQVVREVLDEVLDQAVADQVRVELERRRRPRPRE